MYCAADNGCAATVQILLSAGASAQAADAEGYTALHWAVLNGHFAVVQLLLIAHAAVDAVGACGSSAMH
jgi:protein AFG1